MKYFKIFSFFIFSFFLFSAFYNNEAGAQYSDDTVLKSKSVTVHFFGRDDCKFCKKEKAFFEELLKSRQDFELLYYDITKDENKELFFSLASSMESGRVTPMTVIGNDFILGFDSRETTGKLIIEAIEKNKEGESVSVEDFIASQEEKNISGSSDSGCSENEDGTCGIGAPKGITTVFDIPFFGVVDFKDFSLFSLSFILGLVDGFNPCALWVLMTFLLILLQIGDKKKMWQVAGLFIVAEAIMYYLILNVWYKTWDFVGLDYIVTPAIGFLALGSGVYFIRKYYKTKNKFTCDVASLETQASIEGKIAKIANSPMTVAVALGVVGVAFSVNIIEFACSIGIPQAFTKIIEINALDFISHQFYVLTYVFAYMLDDFFVFGLALWGFDKVHLSYKYSKIATLIGGVLMVILGIILIFFPDFLIF